MGMSRLQVHNEELKRQMIAVELSERGTSTLSSSNIPRTKESPRQ